MSKFNLDTGELKHKNNDTTTEVKVFTLGKLQFYVFITFILSFFVHTIAEILKYFQIVNSHGYLVIVMGYMLLGLFFINYKFYKYRKETTIIIEKAIEKLEDELK